MARIKLIKEFKKFLLRGNAIDLAIGVVIGGALGTVVTALVKGLIMPLIGAIAEVPDLSRLSFTLNNSQFMYGELLNAVISFMLISATVFFLMVKPMNMLMDRMKKDEPNAPATKKCPECLSEIPIEAKRCAYCGQLTDK